MTYQETIDFLFSQLPMYQRSGAVAYKKDIGNIISLCESLGNPQLNFKSIHVGGTNGKGSVSKILSSIFIETDHKVGLYTSPHYLDFRERIQINGEYISKDFVIDFVEQIKDQLEDIQPSFFEITVAMAFSYFSKQQVDIAIIEVGLGGRLDSTNIINPELSIITNIGYDHQQFLGDSLKEIAAEKAGIIKPKTPIIIGKTQQETKDVFEQKANENQSELIFADQNYIIQEGIEKDFSLIDQKWQKPIIIKGAPNGKIQHENIRTAYAAFEELKKEWDFQQSDFQQAILHLDQHAPLIGRWQVIQDSPKVILDSCHNEEGIEQFFGQLLQEQGNLHLIYGTVSDKDVSRFIHLFPLEAHYYLTAPSIPRKMDTSTLEKHFSDFEKKVRFSDVESAIQRAKLNAKTNDVIAVFGSVFLVADALKATIIKS